MIIYDKPLYWHGCFGDHFTILAIACGVFGGLFYLAYLLRPHLRPGILRIKAVVLMYTTAVFAAVALAITVLNLLGVLTGSFREIVRLATRDGQIELTWCQGPTEQRRQYALADVVIRYVPDMRGRTLHHTLVLTKRGDAEALGKIDLIWSRFNVKALWELTPNALLAYQRQLQQTRAKVAH